MLIVGIGQPSQTLLHGVVQEITISQPAVDTQAQYTVPAGKTLKLYGLGFEFVTSAAAANRYVYVCIVSPSATIYYFYIDCATAQTASLTWKYTLALTSFKGAASAVTGQVLPLSAPIVVSAGMIIRIFWTTPIYSDQLSAVRLLVEDIT